MRRKQKHFPRLSASLLFSLLLALTTGCNDKRATKEVEINVMTFNLRYDNPHDSLNWWGYRKDSVLAFLQQQTPEVIGLQEVLHNQLEDLLAGLSSYSSIGVARDDGREEGEYVPILYDTERLELLESGYFWLSDTPDVPSLGWDAACRRVSTWAKLRTKEGAREFYLLNTHFDHQGDTARSKSAEMIREKGEAYCTKKLPVIVVGDFNAGPLSPVILDLVNKKNRGYLIDSYTTAKEGNKGAWTFHDFGQVPIAERERIDYVFYQGDLTPLSHTTFQEEEKAGKQYLSDHAPIKVRFSLP